tara:strand:- start:34682 stop:35128 length:447 start_codon:yes stop_codon:yes gene_type:complete
MRAWPPIQLLIALIFLGASATALYFVMGGRNSPAHSGIQTSVQTEVEGSIDLQITMESTALLTVDALYWGEVRLPIEAEPGKFWYLDHRVLATDGPLRITGAVDENTLPFALLLEIDLPGESTLETIRWIDVSPFSVTVHPAGKERIE